MHLGRLGQHPVEIEQTGSHPIGQSEPTHVLEAPAGEIRRLSTVYIM